VLGPVAADDALSCAPVPTGDSEPAFCIEEVWGPVWHDLLIGEHTKPVGGQGATKVFPGIGVGVKIGEQGEEESV
jgi:hypothetical protein